MTKIYYCIGVDMVGQKIYQVHYLEDYKHERKNKKRIKT